MPLSNEPLLIGVDMGTTSIKAAVYRPDGRLEAMASLPTITHYPEPMWAFHEPEQLWTLASSVIRSCVEQLDDPSRIAGIAVASVGECGIPLNGAGEPTFDAIAWFDRRTIAQSEWLKMVIGEDRLFATSGLSLQPIFSLCKILWIKENQPEAWSRTTRWLHLADYIAYRLSGAFATDYSLASRTLAFDLRKRCWETSVIAEAGISDSLFADTIPSGTKIGVVTNEAAQDTGLPVGIAVGTGGHDHVVGAFAAGVVEPGRMLDSMGTAEALFLPLPEPISDPAMGRRGYTQGAHVVDGKYYAFGGIYTSGASFEWLRDLLGHVDHAKLIDEATRTPIGSYGATFIPHLRLANPPHSDPRARAAFIGLSSDVDRGAAVRAVLEGLAFEARVTLEPLLEYAQLAKPPEISVIGGSTRNELLLRIKASVLNSTHRVLDLEEATSLGAAMLGGIAAGIYVDYDDAIRQIKRNPRRYMPNPKSVAFYDRFYQEVYKDLYQALKPLNQRIFELHNADHPDVHRQ